MRRFLVSGLLLLSFHSYLHGQNDAELLGQVDQLILNSRFAEALALLDDLSAESSSILTENKKAEVLTRLGKLEDAGKLLANIQSHLIRQPEDFLKGITNTTLGFLQLHEGRVDLAEETLRAALRHFESAGKNTGAETAQALSHLGLVYMSQGMYTQAQEQLHGALAIRQKLVKNNDILLAASYNDLGLAYSQTDKDVALDYYERAMKMYLALFGEQDARIAIANINIGITYRDLELYGDAVNNFEAALKIWNDVYPEPHPAKAIALYNLGQTYLKLNDRQSAREFYDKALKMYRHCYGNKHPEIASVFNAIGNLELAESRFEEALQSYQHALHANVQNFNHESPQVNPRLENYYSGTRLLHTLLFKAQAFESRYTRKSLKFSDLREALHILSICDSLIDELRHHSTNESDKMLLGVMANEVYADGVRISYVAGLNAVKKEAYFEKALYFAEKSKGAVLLEAISESNAKSFAGIPTEQLEEEKRLKTALALTAQKLAGKPSPDEEASLRQLSFDLTKAYDLFIKKLEREYPSYFNLKFNSATPSITQIQSLLDDQTAVISYFIDDKNSQLYIFLVRKQQYRMWQRTLPPDLDKYVTGLRNGLYFQEINTYKTSAYTLGNVLLPALPASITDLVILPAGRLSVIPFETLLTDEPGSTAAYPSLPYLLNRFSIRYEFSAGLLLQKEKQPALASKPSIFLCAPVSFPDRPHIGQLPGTEAEVTGISKLFMEKNLTSAAYTHLEADEKIIRTERLKDFRFIHFATHGVVDEAHPELSRILLQPAPQHDGDLFAGEIYNLELDASLVTLSACQTGLGKVVKGEGVIGLSRALVYAGARNLIVSYWNVADESTALLMTDFYKNLLENPKVSYTRSLRHAKLQLAKDERFAAPYYWAPFVLIGF